MATTEQIATLCDILDIDNDGSITPDTPLAQLHGWDSMAVIMVSYYIFEHFQRRVQSNELRNCTTVQQVLNLMQAN